MMNYPWQFDKMILNNQCDSMYDKIMLNNLGDSLTKWWRTISDSMTKWCWPNWESMTKWWWTLSDCMTKWRTISDSITKWWWTLSESITTKWWWSVIVLQIDYEQSLMVWQNDVIIMLTCLSGARKKIEGKHILVKLYR